jgi:hypothetical protein
MKVFFRDEPMVEVAMWLQKRVRLGYIGNEFRNAQTLTPSGDGYVGILAAQHRATESQLIFSRDVGHHTSGWFKNPDYERCEHLSICYRDRETGAFYGKQKWETSREWLRIFFGEARRFVWTEPPFTPEGKRDAVYHFRVFCGEGWVPLLPRGEVYSKELTEKGWKSFSEVRELRELVTATR